MCALVGVCQLTLIMSPVFMYVELLESQPQLYECQLDFFSNHICDINLRNDFCLIYL